jgi:LPPG:FO 2-phospho-L-lactate transferase
MIVALAGGVGGAKLAKGLADVLAPDELMVVVNTGDDFEHLGLRVSPDLDTVMYTLAGINDSARGWGIAGETWNFMQGLAALGGETWFQLGDRDLATHVERTHRLRAGESLSAVTERLCAQLGVRQRVVPMSDEPVRTLVHTTDGILAFQEYFVRRRAEPAVARLEFAGVDRARMAEAFLHGLESPSLSAVVICPSNPYLSIAPILALEGMRTALQRSRVPVIAVSPIVAGRALKGPAAKIMRELGKEPSSLEVARFYHGLIDALVVDQADRELGASISALGICSLVTNTIMKDPSDGVVLASRVIDFVRSLAAPHAVGSGA